MKLKSLLLSALLLVPVVSSAMTKPVFQFTHRLRIETWDNTVNMDDETGNPTTYTRQRSSLGMKWAALPATEFGVKLTHEYRYYISPKTTPFSRNEVVFDNLYLKYSVPTAMPVTLTAGRFNMMLGEGFVVADQSPLDGSRTGYFNAVRADLQNTPNSTVTAFYCQMDQRDYALPVFNSQHQNLADQPETGGGLYWQQKFGVNALHVYYLYLDQSNFHSISDKLTNTFGWRYEWKFMGGSYLTTENTAQWSGKKSDDKKHFGGFTKVGREMVEPIWSLSKVELGTVYLSKNWNPVWGRWPKWSESYIYTLSSEYGVAKWTNFQSLYAQVLLVPTQDSKIQLSYHFLDAFESKGGSSFGNGKSRGNLFICRYDYKINPRLNGCFIAERFLPGNYYVDGSNSYLWLRSELFYTFDLKM